MQLANCIRHAVEDVQCQSIIDTIERCKDLIGWMKKSKYKAMLKDLGGYLVQEAKTRWLSHHPMLKSVLGTF